LDSSGVCGFKPHYEPSQTSQPAPKDGIFLAAASVACRFCCFRTSRSSFSGWIIGPLKALIPILLLVGCAHPPDKLASEDLPNLHRADSRIFSGGQPTRSGFATLAERGVRTIVSVDGAAPDVAAARAAGLRYIHIPIGYDGVPKPAQLALAGVAASSQGPWYVHCHHGKHRAPVAAAILGMLATELSRTKALGLLERAGTGRDYEGLWQAVRDFQPPPIDATLPSLHETVETSDLVAAMARIDRLFDQHKLTPRPQTALLLREEFREARRLLSADAHPDLRRGLADSESRAATVKGALSIDCKSCHRRFRE
jgi:protein tyrosine phosphatase (PTP) superfamily phosphohydrolase (DUF442 family)